MKDGLMTPPPLGEVIVAENERQAAAIAVDTFDGKIHVEWDPTAAVTPIGQLPFFIQFLKVSGLFERWVEQCPLRYRSNNAPQRREVLGSFLLTILSDHNRHAHMTSPRQRARDPAGVLEGHHVGAALRRWTSSPN